MVGLFPPNIDNQHSHQDDMRVNNAHFNVLWLLERFSVTDCRLFLPSKTSNPLSHSIKAYMRRIVRCYKLPHIISDKATNRYCRWSSVGHVSILVFLRFICLTLFIPDILPTLAGTEDGPAKARFFCDANISVLSSFLLPESQPCPTATLRVYWYAFRLD